MIAPVAISFLMITGGMLVILIDGWARPACLNIWFLAAGLIGAGTVFYAFTADAFAASSRGVEALRQVLPVTFHWNIFLPGLFPMAVPVLAMAGQAVGLLHEEK